MHVHNAHEVMMQVLATTQAELAAGRVLAISITLVRSDTTSTNASAIFNDNIWAGLFLLGLNSRVESDLHTNISEIQQRTRQMTPIPGTERPALTLIKTDTKPNPPT